MKNKKIQNKTQKRAAHERVGALALIVATLIGMSHIEHQGKNYLREATAKAGYALSNNSGRENELERMPVSYEAAFRFQTASGQ